MAGNLNMLAQWLQRKIEETEHAAEADRITPGRLSEASGNTPATCYATNTIYDWLSGRSRIPAEALVGWMTSPKLPPAFRHDIIVKVTDGQAGLKVEMHEGQLDLNQDGRVDECDQLEAVAIQARKYADQLDAIVVANRDGKRDCDEHEGIMRIGRELRETGEKVIQIDRRLAKRDLRRPARPPQNGNGLRMAGGGT